MRHEWLLRESRGNTDEFSTLSSPKHNGGPTVGINLYILPVKYLHLWKVNVTFAKAHNHLQNQTYSSLSSNLLLSAHCFTVNCLYIVICL